ncbi:MAG TPA: saccharopine dehydrogenase C-terminal domain-containing protein [Flavitalea sp.]|nr:saccharopine dehydrogenase C-terminal domain-containing protein [Flavitalea sp.]
MKHIVLFGAGKSATCLIDFLCKKAIEKQWKLTVADADIVQAQTKIVPAINIIAASVDVTDNNQRGNLVSSASLVISLLPPTLHVLVAQDCLLFHKDLFTASYLSDDIRNMQAEVENAKLLFLCEMGLDPGIDHMSAMELLHRIKEDGGAVHTFRSHCGGLVAPESDDNPWKYKISWNPRNVIHAGKQGADFLENDEEVHINYEMLFDATRTVEFPGLGKLAYYPNRDSLAYIALYDLQQVQTFVRTTLRYPEFCFGWKHLIDLKLTSDEEMYQTDGLTLQDFFLQHFNKHNFSEWLTGKLSTRFSQSRELLLKLEELIDAERIAGPNVSDEIIMVDKAGDLQHYNIDKVKMKTNELVTSQVYEANLIINQLIFLGIFDDSTLINKGKCSAADVLQFAIETKWKLEEHDKDMIVMLHEIGYEKNGENFKTVSSLVVKGDDNLRTAMAKTVGLPLGIAAILRLEGKLPLNGVHIPILPAIYKPVLKELAIHQVNFNETVFYE